MNNEVTCTFKDIKAEMLKYMTEQEVDRIILMMLTLRKHMYIRSKLEGEINYEA